MSMLGYARLLLQTEHVPSGALIYLLDRDGNNTRFIHRKTGKIHTAIIGGKSLLMFPPASEIAMMLSEVTPLGVMWQKSKDGGWYNIVNMQYGNKVETMVPVPGKKKKRLITYTEHVRIRARTFDQAIYFLFFATLGGRLCKKNLDGRFEYLFWDNLERCFKTEIRNEKE